MKADIFVILLKYRKFLSNTIYHSTSKNSSNTSNNWAVSRKCDNKMILWRCSSQEQEKDFSSHPNLQKITLFSSKLNVPLTKGYSSLYNAGTDNSSAERQILRTWWRMGLCFVWSPKLSCRSFRSNQCTLSIIGPLWWEWQFCVVRLPKWP